MAVWPCLPSAPSQRRSSRYHFAIRARNLKLRCFDWLRLRNHLRCSPRNMLAVAVAVAAELEAVTAVPAVVVGARAAVGPPAAVGPKAVGAPKAGVALPEAVVVTRRPAVVEPLAGQAEPQLGAIRTYTIRTLNPGQSFLNFHPVRTTTNKFCINSLTEPAGLSSSTPMTCWAASTGSLKIKTSIIFSVTSPELQKREAATP